MTTISRETHWVELVDPGGAPVGTARVDEAHRAPGRLHRAFSVFLRAPDGRVLLQRRAAVKTRFPLRWANTCCGHPEPGEDLAVAAARRVAEEIGVTGVELTEVGRYSYYAEDPDSGRVEYEFDHVLLGDLPAGGTPAPDPDEVAEIRWASIPDLVCEIAAEPRRFAPWLAGVTERLAAYLDPDARTRQAVDPARPETDAPPEPESLDSPQPEPVSPPQPEPVDSPQPEPVNPPQPESLASGDAPDPAERTGDR